MTVFLLHVLENKQQQTFFQKHYRTKQNVQNYLTWELNKQQQTSWNIKQNGIDNLNKYA